MNNTTFHESSPILGRGAGLLSDGSPLGGLPTAPPGLGSEGRAPADGLPIGERAPGGNVPILSSPFPLLAPLPVK